MRDLRLTRAAGRDLETIFGYGTERFGEAVASRYRDGLNAAFTSLQQFPFTGRARVEIRSGLRSRPYGSHIVFYLVDEQSVRIIRVLHSSMRAENWL